MELLEVGRIDRAHGVTGEVLVTLTTNRTERLAPGSVLRADDRTLEVVSSRPHQQRHLVRFAGIGDRSEADALRGARLLAEPLGSGEGELWITQLVGWAVVDLAGHELGQRRGAGGETRPPISWSWVTAG
ncbi:MAG: hypothetical protein U5R31_12640 [Acidimicrobiia bacterium]|nr:hypothetical protein [Acidimicrobiia bacterium]